MFPPERIVCLTEETVETLYLLGEDRRIVGVSGYAVRPPQVRRTSGCGEASLCERGTAVFASVVRLGAPRTSRFFSTHP